MRHDNHDKTVPIVSNSFDVRQRRHFDVDATFDASERQLVAGLAAVEVNQDLHPQALVRRRRGKKCPRLQEHERSIRVPGL